MKIRLRGKISIAKGYAAKREKDPEGNETVIAHLKAKSHFVRRDDWDELAGQPIGWSTHMYRDNGEPVAHLSLLLYKRELYGKGSIELRRGDAEAESENPKPLPRLDISKCYITDLRYTLDKLGGLLSFGIAWRALGDEETVYDLLGQDCTIDMELVDVREVNDAGQKDALAPEEMRPARGRPKDTGRRRIEDARKREGTGAGVDHGPAGKNVLPFTNARGKRVIKSHADAVDQAEREADEKREAAVVIHGDAGTPSLPPPANLTDEGPPPPPKITRRRSVSTAPAATGKKSKSTKGKAKNASPKNNPRSR